MGIDGFRYGGRGLIAACLFCLPSLKEGTAADFSSYKSNDGTNIIQISGKIETGDAAQFGQIASSVTGPTAVVLSGNGGIVIEGLKIGEAVHERQFDTAVLNGNQCASSCGLIWLAGAKRYLGVQARVGFHAAYTMAGGEDKETGVGNALIGGYLTRLGLSYAAIIYVTSAPPDCGFQRRRPPIPTPSRPPFQPDRGHHSNLIPATLWKEGIRGRMSSRRSVFTWGPIRHRN